MPYKMKKCKTPECRSQVKRRSVTGTCRHCLKDQRLAKLRRCTQCDGHLGNSVKGNLCGCCISANAQRDRKVCKVCQCDLYRENTTGLCWDHLVHDRAEKKADRDRVAIVRPYSVANLVTAAALATSTTEREVRMDRFRFFCRMRFAISHLAKPHFSTSQIGNALGGKDHSTIVHSQGRALDLMDDRGFVTMMHTIEREALAIAERERKIMERLAA